MIDFNQLFREELIKTNCLEEIQLNQIELCSIEAYDKTGHEFPKDVTLELRQEDQYGNVLSFGAPCSYFLSSLVKDYPYPSDKEFCIDMCGRNHNNLPVYISMDNLNLCIKLGITTVMALHKQYPGSSKEIIVKRCQTCLTNNAKLQYEKIILECNCQKGYLNQRKGK